MWRSVGEKCCLKWWKIPSTAGKELRTEHDRQVFLLDCLLAMKEYAYPPLRSIQGRPLLMLRVTSARPQTVTKQHLSQGEDQNHNDWKQYSTHGFCSDCEASKLSTDPARRISSHSNQWQSHQGRNQWLRTPVKDR